MNSFAPIDPALIDTPSPEIALSPDGNPGYPDKERLADLEPGVLWDCCGAASRKFPDALWIEPKDWADKARENDANDTWPVNYLDRFTNQSPTHECTCHSLRANFEGARNRHRAVSFADGPKKGFTYEDSRNSGSVWVSPLSVYAEANPRQWGGANVRQVLEIACRRGILPDKKQPHEYGFAHTLAGTTGKGNTNQSSGGWVRLSQFPDDWQETAKHFKPLEVIFPESWEQAVCLVLHGHFVSVGRDGHAIPWGMWNVANQSMAYPDSYDVIRYDSLRTVKRAWQGAFSIVTTTVPDDWMKPAG